MTCTCSHPLDVHRSTGTADCARCPCWGYSGPLGVHFEEWETEELRASIAARRRRLAIGYRTVAAHRQARAALVAMEQAFAKRYTTVKS